MKPKFIILLALLTAGTVRGQFIFLSENQSVSASATASVHQISSNFNYTANSGNLGGIIALSDPNPDQYGNSGESAYFESFANLGTGLSQSQISYNSSVQIYGNGVYDGTPGGGSGFASSVFQVSFSVASPQMFQMSCGNFSFFPFGVGEEPETSTDIRIILSSANQGFIFGWGNEGGGEIRFPTDPFSGVLEPGDIYTLQSSMEAIGNILDPLAESASAQANVSLMAVPEPTSVLLLGMGVVGLLLMRRRWNLRR